MLPVPRRIPDAVPWSLYSDGPLSSRPQPLGSGGDAAPCEDTREDFGLSLYLPATSAVAVWLLSVRPMRAKRSQVMSTSGDPDVAIAPCGASRPMSRRDPAVPVRGVRRCSCSRVAIPSRDPGIRLQGAAEWCYHSRQAGTPRKGDQPKDWRATDPKTSGLQPEDWTGRGYIFTLSAPTCSSWTLAVLCPRSYAAVVLSLHPWPRSIVTVVLVRGLWSGEPPGS